MKIDARPQGEEMTEIDRLRVELGERAYDILVGPGLIERAGREILPLLRRRQAVIVSDEIVAGHYLAALRDSLSCRLERRPRTSRTSVGWPKTFSRSASSAGRCSSHWEAA
jgi:hypothetical protein